MKIAFATPEEMGFRADGTSRRFPDWVLLHTDFLRPSEIRARVLALIAEEEADDTFDIEHKLVTMNRTVFDLVTYSEVNCPGPMDYKDVFIWKDYRLVPLLDLHEEAWLCHFALGDIIEREF